jgi:hypothetical protein
MADRVPSNPGDGITKQKNAFALLCGRYIPYDRRELQARVISYTHASSTFCQPFSSAVGLRSSAPAISSRSRYGSNPPIAARTS